MKVIYVPALSFAPEVMSVGDKKVDEWKFIGGVLTDRLVSAATGDRSLSEENARRIIAYLVKAPAFSEPGRPIIESTPPRFLLVPSTALFIAGYLQEAIDASSLNIPDEKVAGQIIQVIDNGIESYTSLGFLEKLPSELPPDFQ